MKDKNKEIAIPKCLTCKKWKSIPSEEWYSSDSFIGVKMGVCTSENVKVNGNYYTDYEGEANDTNVLITYEFKTGANYGCVHHSNNKL